MNPTNIVGSVKNISKSNGRVIFEFSDRYSIFDWGQMPDAINGKGLSLARTAKYFYDLLDQQGIEHAFIECQDSKIILKEFPVIKPTQSATGYDYAPIVNATKDYLIPLEVIFRWGLPQGSSLIHRMPDTFTSNDIGTRFDTPYIEFSTKLEAYDRYLSESEALSISGLSNEAFGQLKQVTAQVATLLKQNLAEIDLELWDGKLEFAWDSAQNTVVVIDSIGIDELRIEKDSCLLSKEFLRQYYKPSEWYRSLVAHKKDSSNWRHVMDQKGLDPASLTPEVLKAAEWMYTAVAESICSRKPLNQSELKDYSWLQRKHQVLILGDGGREHALAVKMAESAYVSLVTIATKKGNLFNHEKISTAVLSDQNSVIRFCKDNDISLVVIGPEAFLVEDYATTLRKEGLNVLGPDAYSAQLESSKDFAKKVMSECDILTARYETHSDYDKALEAVAHWPSNHIVIKADGLAAGKGVFMCYDKEQAQQALYEIFKTDHITPTKKVVLEEMLIGREFSAFALFDQSGFQILGTACDYKRIRDNDQGPNTGGMGTYSPCDWINPNAMQDDLKSSFEKLNQYFQKNQIDFRGVIFAGLMKTEQGIYVLEYNTRFGDPETQSLLPRIKNDLFIQLAKCSQSRCATAPQIEHYNDRAVHVVATAKGYPGTEGVPVQKGQTLQILKDELDLSSSYLFYAGVTQTENALVTSGGRVLGVTSLAATREAARDLAYKNMKAIQFEGIHYRKDIAKKKKFLILASGRGSNAIEIIKKAEHYDYLIGGLICNKADAPVIAACKELGVKCQVVPSKDKKVEDYNEALFNAIKEEQPDWLVLAGYMKVLPAQIVNHFFDKSLERSRILNIHPSLLPNFPGLDAYRKSFDSDAEVGGVTIHYVDEGIDTGPILFQTQFKKEPKDTLESFTQRGLSLEHTYYPRAIAQVAHNLPKEFINAVPT